MLNIVIIILNRHFKSTRSMELYIIKVIYNKLIYGNFFKIIIIINYFINKSLIIL